MCSLQWRRWSPAPSRRARTVFTLPTTSWSCTTRRNIPLARREKLTRLMRTECESRCDPLGCEAASLFYMRLFLFVHDIGTHVREFRSTEITATRVPDAKPSITWSTDTQSPSKHITCGATCRVCRLFLTESTNQVSTLKFYCHHDNTHESHL